MKKQWKKPVIKEIALEFDKDLLACCQTTSNSAHSLDTGGPNSGCAIHVACANAQCRGE